MEFLVHRSYRRRPTWSPESIGSVGHYCSHTDNAHCGGKVRSEEVASFDKAGYGAIP